MYRGGSIAHLCLLALFCLSGPARGQVPASGTIEGRVFNPATGAFLEGVRLRVEGSSIETFTDADGNYRLQQVPAGAAAVTAFFTGTGLQKETVSVVAGGTIQRDFQLSPSAGKRGAGVDDEPIKLDNYVIAASRVMSGAALAINEQRFAPNMKNVVSADEFGDVPEGNVAEFLKFMPGVSVDVTGGHARGVSINGVPADYVPVSIDGFSVASAVGSGGGGGTGRLVAMDMVAINNMSRIEVSFSPTPESEGSALAGSINLVPRSSFERSRPLFKSSVFLMMRDNALFSHKSPGPRDPTRKAHPGFDFSYVAPVNKRFGFSLSGNRSRQSTSAPQSLTTWRGVSVATNGVAFPHTPFDQPYLSTYSVRTGANQHTRSALGATVDLRLSPRDRIAFSFQYSDLEVVIHHNALALNVARVLPGQFTTAWTHGAQAAGSTVLSTSNNTRWDWTYMPSLLWRHDGAVWKAEAGAALARAHHWRDEPREGLFGSTTAQRTGLTVSFDDIFYLRPGVITVTEGASGAPVDPFSLNNYAVTAATTGSDRTDDTRRSAYARVSRDFFGRIPFTVKAGLDFRQAVRDTGGHSSSLTLAGPNNQALPFLDASFSMAEASFGFPRIQAVSSEKLYAHYVANPTAFTANANNEYRSTISSSKAARELVSAAYLRGDVTLFRHRLKLIGGVRAEQTNITAQGPLDDPTRNFQLRADGSPLLGANGRPLPIASTALEISRLTFIARGAKAEKEYLRLFPSLNASLNVRENLVARAAVYTSVGRPNFNQYAGGITLPDTESPPASNNRITVNNVGIKAWSATTVNARLEYYFAGVGQISVGGFRRQISNFFGSTEFEATPEFLALYGLDPALYDGYNVATQHNLPSKVRLDGGDFNYKQALTFLPHWARGVQVFATASVQRTLGDESANFAGFTPRAFNWGASLTRERYNLRAKWNHRSRRRNSPVAAGASIEPGTYNWTPSWHSLDVSAEYSFLKRFAVFANLTNVNNATPDVEISGPSTPLPARFRQRLDFASLWTLGVKATF
jgi:TonB-dependent receptor